MLFKEIGYLLLLYLPVGALILWFYLKRRKQESETVAPFEELKRRPAGESNRLSIQELDEKIDPWLVEILIVPLLLAVVLTLIKLSLIAVIVLVVTAPKPSLMARSRMRES